MLSHDEPCPAPHCDLSEKGGMGDCFGYEDCHHICQCDLIAKVDARARADERDKAAQRVEDLPGLLVRRAEVVAVVRGGPAIAHILPASN
jgi:hypothetical protein